MFLQHSLLPAFYRLGCFLHPRINSKLVVFADAHHTAIPFSMVRMKRDIEALGYQVVCHLHDYSRGGMIKGLFYSLVFMLLYAKARYVFICDNFLPAAACKKRKETQLIQLWHSCGLLKRMGYDTTEDIPPFYKGNVYGNYDLVTVSAPCCIPFLTSGMRQQPGIVQAVGVSRTDMYFDNAWRQECQTEFDRTYPQAKGKRILLWAPTFRGNAASPSLCGLGEIQTLGQKLGEEWFLLIKVHPHLDTIALLQKGEPISNCSLQTERLLPVTDLLITDYSSVLFDFLLLERPFVLFAPDLEEYEADRGFYIDYRTLTPFLTTEEGTLYQTVLWAYAAWKNGTYLQNLRGLKNFHCSACDGKATKRILKLIEMEGDMHGTFL
ncbi:MAG: CDP-glycerol glycerophosphotransferase family protein [Lachnospiraceae bacterium]|nr:CDP-glycerol glycerophosphotransferase family protein [Lachnospiraceae bacterium]